MVLKFKAIFKMRRRNQNGILKRNRFWNEFVGRCGIWLNFWDPYTFCFDLYNNEKQPLNKNSEVLSSSYWYKTATTSTTFNIEFSLTLSGMKLLMDRLAKSMVTLEMWIMYSFGQLKVPTAISTPIISYTKLNTELMRKDTVK